MSDDELHRMLRAAVQGQERSTAASDGQSLPNDELAARRIRRVPSNGEIDEQIRRAAVWALAAADDATYEMASSIFEPGFDPVMSRDLVCFLIGLLRSMNPETLNELRERWHDQATDCP